MINTHLEIDNQIVLDYAKNSNIDQLNTSIKIFGDNIVNITDDDGRTLLWWASIKGHTQVVELLLSKGSNIDKSGSFCSTPVCAASGKNHIQVVELLLLNGADINLANVNNETPLYIASKMGYTKLVELLLSKNADKNIGDGIGDLPIDVATNDDIKDLLNKSNNIVKKL